MALAPARLVKPFLTINDIDVSCFAYGIHLLPEEDTDAITFCDPTGTQWVLTVDYRMSVGDVDSLEEALTDMGAVGELVPFTFRYSEGVEDATNPSYSGTVKLPAFPIVDAEVNGVTSFALDYKVDGDVTRAPAMPAPVAAAAKGGKSK